MVRINCRILVALVSNISLANVKHVVKLASSQWRSRMSHLKGIEISYIPIQYFLILFSTSTAITLSYIKLRSQWRNGMSQLKVEHKNYKKIKSFEISYTFDFTPQMQYFNVRVAKL